MLLTTVILTIEEARDAVRLDGPDNDIILIPLLNAIPAYLEVTTGKDWDVEPIHPLAQTAAIFILQLWYDPQDKDTDRLKATIDGLLIALTAIGRVVV